MQWTRDKYGHFIASAEKGKMKYIAKIYPNGVYLILALDSSDIANIPVSIKDGLESGIKEAKAVCEVLLENLVKEDIVEETPEIAISEEPVEVIEETPELEQEEIVEAKSDPIIVNMDRIITIIVPANSVVRYTTTGKDPKATNKIYKEEFEATEGTIIKAKAWYEDGTVSSVAVYEVK